MMFAVVIVCFVSHFAHFSLAVRSLVGPADWQQSRKFQLIIIRVRGCISSSSGGALVSVCEFRTGNWRRDAQFGNWVGGGWFMESACVTSTVAM